MALKKAPKRKDNTNPNTVLVLFLVFFVLLSIGLGTWGYFGYAGQDKLRDDAKKAKDSEATAKLTAEFNLFQALDARQAIGQSLEPDDLKELDKLRDRFFQEKENFTAAIFKNKPAIENMIKEVKKDIGYDDAGNKYASSYRDRFKTLDDNLKKAQASAVAARAEAKKSEEELRLVRSKIDNAWSMFLKKIQEGNDIALKAAQAKYEAMEKSFARNQELQNLIEKTETDNKAAIDKLLAEKAVLAADLKKATERAANASSSMIRISSGPHALLMDVSHGKPLWDDQLGKITKVNNKEREVTINIGSSIGVKPGLALNVFGAGWKGRAEGLFKGTVEVLQVLGPTSSRARITSLHDNEGKEIALNDQSRGRIQREADNPLKEGDLLFNMVFGTHVVIAGNINWGGSTSDSPAEQMRHLREFMSILQRQGVKVDAYLDLADGKLHGAITPKTRIFIGDARSAKGKGSVTKGMDEDAKKLNEAIAAVRAEAIERGMLIISADNLANIIGHRRSRSANEFEPSGFRPTVPFAGVER
ncbi:MAG: hypothetical protein FJ271_20840 [Planctomycetes bacterium]|nr:hypothetical protein [Planctomycetota bacterium]